MINPQITYTDGTGPATLTFVYPPTNKPAYSAHAQRNDVFSTAGVRQTTVLRVDTIVPMEVDVIQDDDTDLVAWQRFVAWAQQGGTFAYYPDVDNLVDFQQCFMVESACALDRVAPGIYKFKGTFQVEVPA